MVEDKQTTPRATTSLFCGVRYCPSCFGAKGASLGYRTLPFFSVSDLLPYGPAAYPRVVPSHGIYRSCYSPNTLTWRAGDRRPYVCSTYRVIQAYRDLPDSSRFTQFPTVRTAQPCPRRCRGERYRHLGWENSRAEGGGEDKRPTAPRGITGSATGTIVSPACRQHLLDIERPRRSDSVSGAESR